MKRPIPLSQLVEKIQSQTLTPSEAANVFLVEPNREQPFDFHTYINPEAVDVRNFEALARDADLLVRSVVSDGNGRKRRAPKKRVGASPNIVAEGDSWFRLPHLPWMPKTCIDYLQLAVTR